MSRNRHLPPGVPNDGILLYVDPGMRASLEDVARLADIGGDEGAFTITGASIDDSHLSFGSGALGTMQKSSALDDVWAGGATLLVWIRVRTRGGVNVGHIVTTRVGQNGSTGWYLYTRGSAGDDSYNLQLAVRRATTAGQWRPTDDSGEAALPFDRWVCAAITYDSDSTANDPEWYIDSVLSDDVFEAETPAGAISSDAGDPLLIGSTSGGPSPTPLHYDGDLGPMAIYDRELSAYEIRQWYLATRARFSEPGMVLLDRAVATSDVSSLTLNGIKSETDGALFVQGKIIFAGSGTMEMRPRTGAALTSIRGRILRGEIGKNQATENDSTTGWPVCNDNQTGQSQAVGFFSAWIWPAKERHGAASDPETRARLYRSSGVLYASGYTNPVDNYAGGYWSSSPDSDAFDGIVIESPTGINLQTGSEIAVYRLPQGSDPI